MTRGRGVLVAAVAVVLVVLLAAGVIVAARPGHDAAVGRCSHPTSVPTAEPTWSDGAYVVDQDLWNNRSGTQVMRACSYRSWTVTATQPDTRETPDVNSYPDTWRAFPAVPVGAFSQITSRFATHGPGSGVYDFTYDVWLDGVADPHSIEVMVWTRNHGNRLAVPRRGSFTSGGVAYDVYQAGRFVAFVGPPRDRGSVDLLAFFRYAESRGWLSASSTVRRIEFGVEVCKTGGRPLDFALTDYSLTTRR